MAHRAPVDIDCASPPFDHFTSIHRPAPDRSGHGEHARHHLYVGRDKRTSTGVLVKLTSKPGLIYQQNLTNEIETLSAINRYLPDSRYFPEVREHGRLRDGRVFLITSLFSELPLAMAIGTERIPARLVAHLRTALGVGRALMDLHSRSHLPRRSESDERALPLGARQTRDQNRRFRIVGRARPACGWCFLQSADDSRLLSARGRPSGAGCALGCVLPGCGALYDAGRIPMDVGIRRRYVHREGPRDRSGAEAGSFHRYGPRPGKRYPSMQEFHSALAVHLEEIWPGRSWQ